MFQCDLLPSTLLPGDFIGPINPYPSHAVPIFLGVWLLEVAIFEIYQIVKHKPTVSQWIRGVGIAHWFLRVFWIVGVVLLVWHLVWGGPV